MGSSLRAGLCVLDKAFGSENQFRLGLKKLTKTLLLSSSKGI